MSTIHAAVTPPSSNYTTVNSTSVTSTSVIPGNGENSSFKNRLQEFTMRSSIPFPIYETVSVSAPCQLPQFRSSVAVDGETYTSNTFSTKKAAEQDAAKRALEGINKKIKNCVSNKTPISGFPPIFQDKVFCKSILHEFAAKMNMEMPKYDTAKLEGVVPVFITSLIFNGVKYVGAPAVNKKEAEQLAARTAILSNLVDSEIGMLLSEVVKSKAKLFSIVHENIHANSGVPTLQPNVRATLETSIVKEDSGVPSLQPNVRATLDTSAVKEDCNCKDPSQTENVVALSILEQSPSRKGCLEGADRDGNVIENVVSGVVEEESHAEPRHEFRNPQVGTFSPSGTQFITSHLVAGVVEGLSNVVPWNEYKKFEPGTFFPAVPITYVPSVEEQTHGENRKRRKKKKANKKAKKEKSHSHAGF